MTRMMPAISCGKKVFGSLSRNTPLGFSVSLGSLVGNVPRYVIEHYDALKSMFMGARR